LSLRLTIYLIALRVLLNMLLTPALGIHVTTNAGDGNEAISTSGDYKLSDKASLKAMTVLGNGYVYQERNAGGPGNNQL
jgi:hypothetical protein